MILGETTEKPKLLLHSCCGPCSTAVIERLTDEFDVTVFFYNPCITEEKEYQLRRLAAQLRISWKSSTRKTSGSDAEFTLWKAAITDQRDFSRGSQRTRRMSLKAGPDAAYALRQRLEKTAETASLFGVSTISALR